MVNWQWLLGNSIQFFALEDINLWKSWKMQKMFCSIWKFEIKFSFQKCRQFPVEFFITLDFSNFMIFVELLSNFMLISSSWIHYDCKLYFCNMQITSNSSSIFTIFMFVFVVIRSTHGNWYRSYVNNFTIWDGLLALAVAFPSNLSKYCCATNKFVYNEIKMQTRYICVNVESASHSFGKPQCVWD